MLFDSLLNTDAFISDVSISRKLLIQSMGLDHLDDYQVFSLHGVELEVGIFPVHPDPSFGITQIELIAPFPLTLEERLNPYSETFPVENPQKDRLQLADYISAWGRAQFPNRIVRTHATAILTSEMQELRDRLDRQSTPYRLTPGTGYIWLGLSHDPIVYDPKHDGGLFLEFIPVEGLVGLSQNDAVRFAAGDTTARSLPDLVVAQQEYPDVAPGTMVRLTARQHLVDDSDRVISDLRATFGWPSEEELIRRQFARYRSVTIKPQRTNSATLELVQPTSPVGRIADDFRRYGAGPYYNRIGVAGLSEKLFDLESRGTEWTDIDPIDGRSRVALNPFQTGVPFELEELERPDRNIH